MTRNPRRLLIMLALAASLATLPACCLCGRPPAPEPGAGTNQVLVKFKEGTSAARIAQIASELGLLGMGTPLPGYHLFRALSPEAAGRALQGLKNLPEVESAQPDRRYRPAR